MDDMVSQIAVAFTAGFIGLFILACFGCMIVGAAGLLSGFKRK